MDEMLKKYLLEKHGLNTDTLQPSEAAPVEEVEQPLVEAPLGEQPQSNQVFPEARPVEQIIEESKPKDVAAEQAEIGSKIEPVAPEQTKQLSKTLDEGSSVKAEEDHAKMVKDPVSYIKQKYGLHPDVSYDELKKVQRKSSIMDALGDFDTAFGQLGSHKLLGAKRAGYDGKYVGGALNKQAKRMKADFDERLKYQTDEQDRVKKGIETEKSSIDLAKAGVSFDQMIKDEKELDDPNSFLGKMLSDQAKQIFGEDKIPVGITPRQMLKIMPSLADITKTKMEKSISLENDLKKEEAKFGYDKQLKEMELKKIQATESAKPTEGQSTSDKEFAKDYTTWITETGSISPDKSIANLNAAIAEMEKPENKDLTGGTAGKAYVLAGDKGGRILNPKIARIETNLRSAVVDTLRPLLGGQFAAIEGERIMQQTFDATQPMVENVRRAKLVLDDQVRKLKSRERAVKWWEANNSTLKGYKAFDGEEASTEKVRVISPDGKVGLIPRSQLDSALKQGYKESN